MSESYEMFKKLEQEENRKQKELKALQENLEKAKKAVQKDCPHVNATYHVDPAGDSSDSYYECNRCGYEW